MDRKTASLLHDMGPMILAMSLVMGAMFAAVAWLSPGSDRGDPTVAVGTEPRPEVADRADRSRSARYPSKVIRLIVDSD